MIIVLIIKFNGAKKEAGLAGEQRVSKNFNTVCSVVGKSDHQKRS